MFGCCFSNLPIGGSRAQAKDNICLLFIYAICCFFTHNMLRARAHLTLLSRNSLFQFSFHHLVKGRRE